MTKNSHVAKGQIDLSWTVIAPQPLKCLPLDKCAYKGTAPTFTQQYAIFADKKGTATFTLKSVISGVQKAPTRSN